MEEKDILIVGAGPAGIGLGVALQKISARFGILERAKTGASFRRWPQETRMITPSFTSNAFNLPDLNALTPETSPAYSLGREHPRAGSMPGTSKPWRGIMSYRWWRERG